MVPAEFIFGTIAAVGAIATALFGGGLLRQAFAHSNELAVQKHELARQKDLVEKSDIAIQRLKTDVELVNKDVAGFATHVKKLEMLPEISSKLSGLEATMAYLKETLKDFRSERLDHDKKT